MKNEEGTNLVVRLTLEEMDAIKKAAADREINVSQYVRSVVFKRKTKRQIRSKVNKKSEWIPIRVTPEEKEKIQKIANESGLSVSDAIRSKFT